MDYSTRASTETIVKVAEALRARNIEPLIVDTKADALERIKNLIPAGASVHNGSSTTLKEIGYIDYLKSGEHQWNNLQESIANEQDQTKQTELRKQSVFADYYLGSVHALTETGQLVIASASGSQLPPIVYTASNIIFVVGVQKITPHLEEALDRVRNYVYPLEDERMKSTGAPGSILAKLLIIEQEPAFSNRKVRLILVNENLGF